MQAAAALLLAAQDSSSDDIHMAGVLHDPAAGDGLGGRPAAAAAEASPAKQMLVSTVSKHAAGAGWLYTAHMLPKPGRRFLQSHTLWCSALTRQRARAADMQASPAIFLTCTLWLLQVDPVAWKLEVERVAPKLRVAVAPDMRDWRQHLEVAHTHMGTMAAAWPDVR
jgi:hypothetical protein